MYSSRRLPLPILATHVIMHAFAPAMHAYGPGGTTTGLPPGAQDVVGEDYLGIRIFRFYFHCKNCGAEISMKTDPKNSDYAMEQGATRNYEPWREKEKVRRRAAKL
jgi:Saf4/Yju2 protein